MPETGITPVVDSSVNQAQNPDTSSEVLTKLPDRPGSPEAQAAAAAPQTTAETAQTVETKAPDADAKPDQKSGEQQEKTDEQPEKRGKSRYERRLDSAYRQKAEAEAKAEFYAKQLAAYQPRQPDSGAPTLEGSNYDPEAYAEAKAKYSAEKAVKEYESRLVQGRQAEEQRKLSETWQQKVDKADKKYDDFDEIVGEIKPDTPLKLAIMQAENGADIAHYLGSNLNEAQRIVSLDPVSQVREIGRLEARLAAEPVRQKTVSKAPAPISPVSAASGPVSTNLEEITDIGAWIKARNKQVHGR